MALNRVKTALFLYAKVPFSPLDGKPEVEAEALATEIRHLLERRSVRLSVFLPGPLAEAMARKCPKDVAWMRERVISGHLEFVGGGYHDPMLPLFPAALQELQLQKHKDILRQSFGSESACYFNSSMAWEIGMVEILEKRGFDFALVPESALQEALGRQTGVTGWYTTEDRGAVMRLLSFSGHFSQLWLQGGRPEIIAGLKALPDNGKMQVAAIPVLCDSPDSIHALFAKWAEIFDTSDSEGLEIQTWTLSHVLEQQAVEGKVSLVSTVGSEVGLPPGTHSCRELLLRRPEIDFLHKKMLAVYRRCCEVLPENDQGAVLDRLLSVMSSEYYCDLQTGIRHPTVRWKAHRDILAAEKILNTSEESAGQRVAVVDMLMDGQRQILAGGPDVGFVIEPRRGGWLRSLDYRPAGINLAGALRDDGEVSPLFLEHIIPEDIDQPNRIDSWIQDRQGALLQPYDYQIKRHGDRMQVLLDAEQSAYAAGRRHSFRTEKVYSIKAGAPEFLMGVQFTNSTFQAFRGYFATELCIGFRDVDVQSQFARINGHRISLSELPVLYPEATRLDLRDRLLGVALRLETMKPVRLLIVPMLGSGSNASPDKAQGLRIVLFRDVELKGQETASLHVRVRLGRGKGLLG